MRILKLTLLISLMALTASPTYAATYHRKRHHAYSVNGATSVLPNSGSRGKSTRTGGPSGGASVH